MKKKVFITLMTVFIASAVLAVANIAAAQIGYASAKNEYDDLSELAVEERRGSDKGKSNLDFDLEAESDFTKSMRSINPDYVGWIQIKGTGIDYPIVRGVDNDKYLNTTFHGDRNVSGAIFMDAGCHKSFNGYVVLYGHNMKDGSMFAELHDLHESMHWNALPRITITMPDGSVVHYKINDIRVTHVSDIVYTLPIMSGTGTLILSTCTSNSNNRERLVVEAEIDPDYVG